VSFISAHRERWGIEPICKTLQVAPSTYYAAVSHQPSVRQLRDEWLKHEIARVHRSNFGVYGIEKVCANSTARATRPDVTGSRDSWMTSVYTASCAASVSAPPTQRASGNGRPTWSSATLRPLHRTSYGSADLTYVSTWSGFVYVAFIIDVLSRFIVGWRVSNSLHADVALDALEMAIWRRHREDRTGLIHHSDRGVRYLSIRYTERLAEAGAVCSVGSRGDSYENALAEALNDLYKAELIRKGRTLAVT
jgi:putative transposase